MHTRMLATIRRGEGDTSESVRNRVYNALLDDPSFVGDGGHFGAPVADWFVIGGRWSGELSRFTWAKAVEEQLAKREEEEGVKLWGAFYGESELAQKQQKLLAEAEALYSKAVPLEYRESGLCYNRDTYGRLGYADDAMVVNQMLYDLFLKPYEGLDQSEDVYADLDWEAVSPDFIHTKWLVVIDYHS